MSFALFAAPFNENHDDDNIMNKKKQTHNKTQKTMPKDNFNKEKVNSVLEKIHNDSHEENEKDSLGDFNPPPPPESSGVAKTVQTKENMINMSNDQNNVMFKTLGRNPQPNYDDSSNLDLNNYVNNYGDGKSVEEYYKQMLPNYTTKQSHYNRPYYTANMPGLSADNDNNDLLMQKINYMINLLEEQQDERTNNVTEEVILYSFLGIFMICIVDSFVKVGKYVR
jgi:hypothetical protein